MKSLEKVRTAIRTGHAHFSFLCAVLGGMTMAVTPIGHTVAFVSKLGWWFMPLAWAVGLLIVMVGDWARDAIPNRPAVVTALLWPSCLAIALTGDRGGKFFSSVKWISPSLGATWQKNVDHWLNPTGDAKNALMVFSVIFMVAAIVYAQRFARDAKKAATGSPVGSRFAAAK